MNLQLVGSYDRLEGREMEREEGCACRQTSEPNHREDVRVIVRPGTGHTGKSSYQSHPKLRVQSKKQVKESAYHNYNYSPSPKNNV
ncbi:hypothetical protein BaRGS_00037742 [Batillaria attramentaria]|uniref:Uncharacterized protein n=1 Tax=Batillaria attramentaria TaxID=370345 RepID=A0ABD0J7X8_9CAEN